jgi:hypothetical protein
MATVDSDKVVCGGIYAMIVAVLVNIIFLEDYKLYPITSNSLWFSAGHNRKVNLFSVELNSEDVTVKDCCNHRLAWKTQNILKSRVPE